MNEKNLDLAEETASVKKPEKKLYLAIIVLLGALVLFESLFDVDITINRRQSLAGAIPDKSAAAPSGETNGGGSGLENTVLPRQGVTLPVKLGDIGVKLAATGVIDAEKFKALYQGRGGAEAEATRLISEVGNGNIVITEENAPVLLNLFWALGLGTKNAILENGPMADPRYGGAGSPAEALAKVGNFASIGGWTISAGDSSTGLGASAMNHYARHPFIALNAEQQTLVERVAKNIYRPCCNNPTHFPDCNHGMAMLGLLELMASQGVTEQEMYKTALKVNSYWFPENYMTIAKYLESRGTAWVKADAKEILGANYSSASGYQRILAETTPSERKGGGSCGV